MSGAQDDCKMKPEFKLYCEIVEAEEDVRAGRIAPIQDTFDDVRSKLLKLKSESQR